MPRILIVKACTRKAIEKCFYKVEMILAVNKNDQLYKYMECMSKLYHIYERLLNKFDGTDWLQ